MGFKDWYHQLTDPKTWQNSSSAARGITLAVFLCVLSVNTVEFVILAFSGFELWITFWYYIVSTALVTFIFTKFLYEVYMQAIGEPVNEIKSELTKMERNNLSSYAVSGKVSRPFRISGDETWQDQVAFYIDAATSEKYLDELTGCFNRKYYAQKMVPYMQTQNLIGKHEFEREKYGIFMIDIDHFKNVNDSYGHSAGDDVIASVGYMLREYVSDRGVVIRYGGEEFVIIYLGLYDTNYSDIASEIKREFAKCIRVTDPNTGVKHKLTCSIGYAVYPFFKDADSLLSLNDHIKLADMAMYYSKVNGRDQWHGLRSIQKPNGKIDKTLYTEDMDYGLKRGFYEIFGD
ncbi:MAG: GGDEF domain-containing protein [Saccharofermentans sp.]|nr:GGDEF domain-containing protein [Saccharofermentans sp.]